MTVLVAHRHEVVRNGIAAAVRGRLGVSEVVLADGTAACVSLVRLHRLRAAVLDADLMPGAEPFLCALMRDHDVPSIVVSRADDLDPLPLLEAGARGIVLPTGGLDELLTAVRTVLRGDPYVPAPLLGILLKVVIVERRARQTATDPVSRLSPREREVLVLLGVGADHREIARRLVISPHTAKTHIQRLLAKLEVRSRVEAAALAADYGLTGARLETGP